MVRAAERRGLTSIVRVPRNEPSTFLKFLDTGAQGAQVPNVNSAAEGECAIQAIKYQPRGRRGLGSVRAADFGQCGSFNQYVQEANAETMVVLQVETPQAAHATREIARLEGVDVVFIGPTDLSNSLGHPGELDHPEVAAALEQIISGVLDSPAALGILAPNADQARTWRNRGARYIATPLEALLSWGVRDFLRSARQ
jgi:4-hydroxy-2-oxoheptanedioate aldolase